MRIVRLANFIMPRSGGLRTALRCLGEGYLAAGHEPVLVVPGERAGDDLTPYGRVITVPGPEVPGTGGYRVLLGRRRLGRLLADLRPDRLEVSDRFTLRWTGRWAREREVPAVMVSHESLTGLLGVAGLPEPAARRLADLFNARSARGYDRIVCTTAWAAEEFRRIAAPNLVEVPLGVDLDLFHPGARDDALRARYARPDQLLIVHCGRLSTEKEPGRSVAALAALYRDRVDAVLVVAGDGPLRPRLIEQAAGLPVRFTRFLDDRSAVAALLATADVALAPGPIETFGLAALEALACGTPVVVNAASALPEVVGDAGVAVRGDFARGVREIIARPEAARRAAARARAERFGWPASAAGFLAAHGATHCGALTVHRADFREHQVVTPGEGARGGAARFTAGPAGPAPGPAGTPAGAAGAGGRSAGSRAGPAAGDRLEGDPAAART
ncbi:glycosyltransferase [Planosporangium sp. 12N6]|uniref:glycosyltransferase n=1 Tax=Planosporangium spinosum TaxID=3402278 RepID=UPI003CE8291D